MTLIFCKNSFASEEAQEPVRTLCVAYEEGSRKSCCRERYTISPADDPRYFNAVECCVDGYETPDALACCMASLRHSAEPDPRASCLK